MPVELSRLEPGIYRTALSGEIMLNELTDSQARGAQMAAEHGDSAYVLIIDIRRGTSMPFDIRNTGQLVEKNNALAVLSVGASFHIRFLVSLLGRFFQIGHVEHHGKLENAVDHARQILAEHQRQPG